MKSLFYFIVSFCVCAILGISSLWVGFGAVMLLFNRKITSSMPWEIAISVLVLSIAADIFPGQEVNILRVFIPAAAVLTACTKPKKLIIVFALSILALLLKNAYALGIMGAVLLESIKTFYHKKQVITR